eukprot:7994144-Alexandrium_andersonii.AAC.1
MSAPTPCRPCWRRSAVISGSASGAGRWCSAPSHPVIWAAACAWSVCRPERLRAALPGPAAPSKPTRLPGRLT